MKPDNIFDSANMGKSPPSPRTTLDWAVWVQWVLATTAGWVLGLVLGGELGVGAFIGLTQWLVLRRYFANTGWWVLASGVGWLAGWAIVAPGLILPPDGGLLASIIAGAIFGITMGVAQWMVLRRWVKLAGMWILISIPGWTIGLIGLLGTILAGAVAGAVTGFAFDFLLRFPQDDVSLKN